MAGTRAVRISLVILLAALLMSPLCSLPAEGAYTSTPIVVQGDTGFVAAGFTGSGTVADPYVLNGYHVDASFEHHGIYIANTTKHFRIVDCSVNDAYTSDRDRLNVSASGSGILLYNVINGEVVDYVSDYNVRGVTVVNSENVTITSSLFSNNIEAGVYFYDCVNGMCQASNCTFSHDETGNNGVLVEDSQGITVRDNVIEDGRNGINLVANAGSCTGNLVTKNVVRGQTEYGILLGGNLLTSENLIQKNQVQGVAAGSGICVEFGTQENITGNQVSGCLYGIRLMWDNNSVSGNALSNNTQGIMLGDGSDDNLVLENSLKDGAFGVLIAPSQGNIVRNNTILRMDQSDSAVGVYLGIGAVRDAIIENNTISDCNVGIRAATTAAQEMTRIFLTGNAVNNSIKEGAYLLYVSDSQVLNNNFHANGYSGLYLGAQCHELLIQNNTVDGNQRYGLEIRAADDNLVTGNIFDSNVREGVYLYSGSGNVIYANALLFNKDSGRQYSSLRVQAYCGEQGNSWSLGIGNLWADWLTPDQNDDGIVDQPYTIPDNFQDPFPLTEIAGLDIPVDLTAPEVIYQSPQGTSAEHDSAVNVTFSEDMDLGSIAVSVNNITQNGTWTDRTFTLSMTLEFETDYSVSVIGQDLAGNNLTEFTWTFRTEGPNATVSGRVLANGSLGLAGVNVTCDNVTVQTDEEGHFSLLLTPGDHTLYFSMEGYRDGNLTVQVLPGEDMDMGDVIMFEEEPLNEPSTVPYITYLAAIVIIAFISILGIWMVRRKK
ncbi:MAG: right-handed parallel beta-helix repeat-containing protein [Methanomassiliicoccales archaeon]|nr:right-handed parallel beta-helix repeat-containing protein [Methanomassiliicoccales archaeon]